MFVFDLFVWIISVQSIPWEPQQPQHVIRANSNQPKHIEFIKFAVGVWMWTWILFCEIQYQHTDTHTHSCIIGHWIFNIRQSLKTINKIGLWNQFESHHSYSTTIQLYVSTYTNYNFSKIVKFVAKNFEHLPIVGWNRAVFC